MIEWRDPWLLSLALLAIPVYRLARRPAGRLTFSSTRYLLPARSASWRARLAFVPPLCLALAVACWSAALAGPRIPDQTTRVQRKGIAIACAIDTSGSMRALDLSEPGVERTRLDAAKEVLRDFVRGDAKGLPGRPDDAVGLITFARFADCRCPLTLDHRSLLAIAADVTFVTDRAEDGTAIGEGLGLALERLRGSKAESKVVILLTDGVNNAGETTPVQATEVAAALSVRVYTIATASTEAMAPVRVEDPFSGRTVLRSMPIEIDEAALRAIAEKTGGRYFRASDAEGLREVYREIDRLERTEVAETRYLQYDERFEAPAAAGLGLLGLGLLLGASVFRRAPS